MGIVVNVCGIDGGVCEQFLVVVQVLGQCVVGVDVVFFGLYGLECGGCVVVVVVGVLLWILCVEYVVIVEVVGCIVVIQVWIDVVVVVCIVVICYCGWQWCNVVWIVG